MLEVCKTLITKAVYAGAVFKTSNNTQTGGLGMPLSWQSISSGLRENLEHVPVTLDNCVHQKAAGEREGMSKCEILGVHGGFCLKL